MESLWDASLQTIESFVDEAAFRLLGIRVPVWYINTDIKAAFGGPAAWDTLVASSTLSVAPGLDIVLSSTQPPSIDFFTTLPRPSMTRKQWGIYALVMTKSGAAPKLYIGSGTAVDGGVQGRVNSYLSGAGPFSRLVRLAKDDEYEMASIGLICWTDAPPPHLVPRLRARMLVLESVFTIVFCACTKMIMDDVYIPDFFLWRRGDVGWEPACTHLSFSESVHADLKLTQEELNDAAAARVQRGREKQRRCRERKRQQDAATYLQEQLDQHNAWSARNPGRVNDIAAGVRARAKEDGRFRCEICNHNAATQYNLDNHLQSQAHAEAVRQGGKAVKPLSAATLRKKASRAAARASRLFFCKPCQKACTSATDLKRHNEKAKHKESVKKTMADGRKT